ncbi:response regulator [Desulfobulbus rhabdoformis]|uniref:response regulator n=1 Tax=Desulfobulbus rhabdoformis TaxID=34032 RepID=UPI001965B035|nr:response regulator [Desulfobulbus rhabdoformis]MBM9614855.1 response regulator [Desulfobulbus rhabdoformis]
MIQGKILIIDDEVEFASTLRQRLALRGMDVSDAHSGTEGLEQLAGYKPDIVLLDLKMPDMNGLDILSLIKEKYPHTEVIMLTGHGSVAAGIEAMEKGAFDYIMKPVDLRDLLVKIEQAAAGMEQTSHGQ